MIGLVVTVIVVMDVALLGIWLVRVYGEIHRFRGEVNCSWVQLREAIVCRREIMRMSADDERTLEIQSVFFGGLHKKKRIRINATNSIALRVKAKMPFPNIDTAAAELLIQQKVETGDFPRRDLLLGKSGSGEDEKKITSRKIAQCTDHVGRNPDKILIRRQS